MSHIRPKNPELLTDHDVEYSFFHCCGDEDLVFLRCEACAHIWVECYECSTWYTDLADLSRIASSFMSHRDERLACPRCGESFRDFHYFVDAYFPTAAQVIAAGYERFLSEPLRRRFGIRDG